MDEERPGHRWARPLLVSVTALAVMAVLTLATIVQSPDAKAGADATPTGGGTAPGAAAPGGKGASTAGAGTEAGAGTGAAGAASPVPSQATRTGPPSPGAPRPATAGTRTTATASPAHTSPATRVRGAVARIPHTGDLAVAVTDLDDGSDVVASGGDFGRTYDTASIVKVDILAALLLRHQRAGTTPSAGQRALAAAMIERSDNDAATALWDAVGGAAGLAEANRALGLTATTGGSGELWGLTQTTAADQIALLRAVFDGGSALSAASRAYIRALMGAVSGEQRWGVSAADGDGSGYALKNGWLRRTATGRWDVNSIGEVSRGGHRLLIAVLSRGQLTEQAGIDLVEHAALAAAKAWAAAA